MVAAPHETRQDGRCSKTEQNDTDEEETDALIVAAPCPGARTTRQWKGRQAIRSISIATHKRHVLESRGEVSLETQHTVAKVDHRETRPKTAASALDLYRTVHRTASRSKGVIQNTGQCDGPWNRLVLHCESPVRITLLPIRRPSRHRHRTLRAPAAANLLSGTALTSSTMTVRAVRFGRCQQLVDAFLGQVDGVFTVAISSS